MVMRYWLTRNNIVKHFNLRSTSIVERSEQGGHLPREGEDGRGRVFMLLFAYFIIGGW